APTVPSPLPTRRSSDLAAALDRTRRDRRDPPPGVAALETADRCVRRDRRRRSTRSERRLRAANDADRGGESRRRTCSVADEGARAPRRAVSVLARLFRRTPC